MTSIKKDEPKVDLRSFKFPELENHLIFKNNSIKTSKYSCLSFLPLNLMEQFSKTANIYFLIIMILQIIPIISVTNGQPTLSLPLAFVVIVSAIKDIIEDYKKHKSDDEENNKILMVAEEQ
jgi:phospholipid-transporting ATPase